MNEEDKQIEETETETDDSGDILVEEHIKIFDPETKEIYINFRG